MKKLLCAAALVLASSAAQATDEVGRFIYEYQAGTYRVQTLRYGPESANQLLIKVSGIDNDQDGRIYLHTRQCDTSRCDSYRYVTTQVHKPGGTQWFTIHNPGGYSGGEILNPYLVEPASPQDRIYLRDKAQTNLDPDFFLANYKRQQGLK
jgi:2,4-dienoyl-CoA reductase-like NADH-dependent reductase (Old Yellow Enzyme family)